MGADFAETKMTSMQLITEKMKIDHCSNDEGYLFVVLSSGKIEYIHKAVAITTSTIHHKSFYKIQQGENTTIFQFWFSFPLPIIDPVVF